MRRKTGDTTNSSTNLTGWAACSAVAFALLGSSAALADEAADIADLKARLEALERAYTELYVSDREKSQTIEELQAEIARHHGGGTAAAGAATATTAAASTHDHHDHGHDHGVDHDHSSADAAHDHNHAHGPAMADSLALPPAYAGHAHDHGSDVLTSAGPVDILIPSFALDGFYYTASNDGGIDAVLENLDGFAGLGHDHEHEDEDHDHDDHDEDHDHDDESEESGHDHAGHTHGLREGFTLRHAEIGVGARIPNVAEARFLVNGEEDEGLNLEEAYLKSLGLPGGFGVKAGKYKSGFGFFNALHSPYWDFADQPLVYQLVFGSHGLTETGVQATWNGLAGPVGLHLGAEVANSDNEVLFAASENENADDHQGPDLGVGWIGVTPPVGTGRLDLQAFGGYGLSQLDAETVLGEEAPGTEAALDGRAGFVGGGVRYTIAGSGQGHEGDLSVTGEYIWRRYALEPKGEGVTGDLENYRATQDGYYLQGVYGFLPRLRGGLRFEQVGLTNNVRLPDGDDLGFKPSWRAGVMSDWEVADGLLLRGQLNQGRYRVSGGEWDDLTEFYLQLVARFGPHAH